MTGFNQAIMTSDIEFSEEMFLITTETADASKQKLEETKSALRDLGLPDDIVPH